MTLLRFRAWDNKNKKWLLGYEYPNLGGFSLFGECVMFGEWSSILNHFFHEDVGMENLIVDQSTGLKDKNGVECFADDIVKVFVDELFVSADRIGLIEWSEASAAWYILFPNEGVSMQLGAFDEFEVIGNIHENGELIGEDV